MTTQALTLKVTQPRVVRSEWIKFWSLRSTIVTLAVAVALVGGLGLIAAAIVADGGTLGEDGAAPLDSTGASLAGITFSQLAFGTLGVLFMASEYSTGMIRSSLSAVPRRLPVLWGKIIVFAGVAFALSLVAAVLAFSGGQALIGDDGASWSDPGVVRAVIGSAFVLTGTGTLGLALGALLRSVPAAITTLFGVMFLLSTVIGLLAPESLQDDVVKFTPATAAASAMAVTTGPDVLAPAAGFWVFTAYIALATAAAAWRLKRADA